MYWAFPRLLMTQLLWSQQGGVAPDGCRLHPEANGESTRWRAIVETVERFWTTAQHQSREVDKSLGRMRPSYFSKTFLMSPTFFWIFPPRLSSVPSAARSGSLVTWAPFSFTLPFSSCTPPSILSFVLSFIALASFTCRTDISNFLAETRTFLRWRRREA